MSKKWNSRFKQGNTVKVSSQVLSLYPGKVPDSPGTVQSENFVGQILSLGIQFQSGEFRWLPEAVLELSG